MAENITSTQPVFRVIVAGSRHYADYSQLRGVCDNLLADKSRTHRIVIVSGGAQGADSLGEDYARERGYSLKRYSAQWDKYGRAAGPIRNAEMARNADALILFWNGKSSGSRNMKQEAEKQGLPVRTVMID